MKNETPATRLRAARKMTDLSQAELSALAGLTKSHVGMLEGGTIRDAGAHVYARVARVLGLSLDWLCLGEGKPPNAKAVQAAVKAARESRAAE